MLTPGGQRPNLSDYQSAVARLQQCSEEPRLKRCVPRLGADGQPGADGGSFGAVYRLDDPEDGRSWALKCFLREEPGRGRRYRRISECLGGARGTWQTEVHYMDNGLWVHQRWWPVVLMEWVPGARLTDWIDALLEQRPGRAGNELRRLTHSFASEVHQMHRSGISHGDLQSGNVLVTPGCAVRFVDYDAMTVPGWTAPPRREDGHPDFRLPREGERGPDGATEIVHTAAATGTGGTVFAASTSTGMPLQEPDALTAIHRDRFPSHVIHTALVILSHDASLWTRLHRPGADHLLLSRKDFRDPAQSRNWGVLLHHETPQVRRAAEKLRAMLDCPVHLQADLVPQPEAEPGEDVLRPLVSNPLAGHDLGRPLLDNPLSGHDLGRPLLDLTGFAPADHGEAPTVPLPVQDPEPEPEFFEGGWWRYDDGARPDAAPTAVPAPPPPAPRLSTPVSTPPSPPMSTPVSTPVSVPVSTPVPVPVPTADEQQADGPEPLAIPHIALAAPTPTGRTQLALVAAAIALAIVLLVVFLAGSG
ncbi:protein kinase family protein [Streptomyces mangrovisoli]|uniref:Protein kinase domain-containing protein n=1 Tax=Streptomyces mangrovisoli TaxID=1428628 RepID=A0A1J4NNN6_9ACTN|nr:protein kinase family protein [Streptomyces mangrovisoli]OIJ63204.1 hypothetical protein WN71_035425 [Streptomyces mangrovisoli]